MVIPDLKQYQSRFYKSQRQLEETTPRLVKNGQSSTNTLANFKGDEELLELTCFSDYFSWFIQNPTATAIRNTE